MSEKISQYPVTATSMNQGSFLDISQDVGGGVFQSQKLPAHIITSGGGSSNTIVFTQGGQWAYNGNTWRIASPIANIGSANSSTIAVSTVTYPFDGASDFGVYNNADTVGFPIPRNGNIKSLSTSIYNVLANQDIAVIAVVMRYNGVSKRYEYLDSIETSGAAVQNELLHLSIFKDVPVQSNDIIYFSTASEVNQGVTLRNFIAFTIEIELN